MFKEELFSKTDGMKSGPDEYVHFNGVRESKTSVMEMSIILKLTQSRILSSAVPSKAIGFSWTDENHKVNKLAASNGGCQEILFRLWTEGGIPVFLSRIINIIPKVFWVADKWFLVFGLNDPNNILY